jgi:hypothetical protein
MKMLAKFLNVTKISAFAGLALVATGRHAPAADISVPLLNNRLCKNSFPGSKRRAVIIS